MTKEQIIEECKSRLLSAYAFTRSFAGKQFVRYYVIADHYIDLLLEEYDYDFLEENEGFALMYKHCTEAFSDIRIASKKILYV